MATNPMRLTADDLLDMEVPEHLRGYELVDGELVEVSLPSPPHGLLAARIAHLLLDHVEAYGVRGDVYGEAGYVLGLRHDRNGFVDPTSRTSAKRRSTRMVASLPAAGSVSQPIWWSRSTRRGESPRSSGSGSGTTWKPASA